MQEECLNVVKGTVKMNKDNILKIINLERSYSTVLPGGEKKEYSVLKGISFQVRRGEFISIMGSSGCGKTTLLKTIGMLNKPNGGKILYNGEDTTEIYGDHLAKIRRTQLAFIFQDFYLMNSLSVEENIMLPMHISGQKKKKEKALELLEQVGMTAKRNNRLNTMSGGEQQRIAIAIALANNPKLLLADEPTGSVDTKTADIIFDIFRELNRNGQTILIVTHEIALSKKVRRVVAIRDGKISSERILKEKYADRLKELTVDWRNEDTQEEYAVIDKAGRVQIPRELWDKLALRDNKVKLDLRGDEILLSRPTEDENRNM